METDASSSQLSASQPGATLHDARPGHARQTASEDGIEDASLHCGPQEAGRQQQGGASESGAAYLTAVPMGTVLDMFAAAVFPCCVEEALDQVRQDSAANERTQPADPADWGSGKALKGLKGMFLAPKAAKDGSISKTYRTAKRKPAAGAVGTSSAFVFTSGTDNSSSSISTAAVALPKGAQQTESAADGTVGKLLEVRAVADTAGGGAGAAADPAAVGSAAVPTALPATAPAADPAAVGSAAVPTTVPATDSTADPAAVGSAAVPAAVPAADPAAVGSAAVPTTALAIAPAADSAAVVPTPAACQPSHQPTPHPQQQQSEATGLSHPPEEEALVGAAAGPAAGTPSADPAEAAANAGGPTKDTLLHVALLQAPNKAPDAALLEQHAADINACDTIMGWTPLHYAAATHNTAAVEQLLAAGADSSAVAASSGLTPLHLAVIPKQGLSTLTERQSLKKDTASLYSMQTRLGSGSGKTGRPGCLKIVQMLLAAGAGASAAAEAVAEPGANEALNHGMVGAQPLHLAACVCILPGKKQTAAAAVAAVARGTAAVARSAAARIAATTAAAVTEAEVGLLAAAQGVHESSSAPASVAAVGAAAAAASGGGGGGVSSVPTGQELAQHTIGTVPGRGSPSDSLLAASCKVPVVNSSAIPSSEASSAVTEQPNESEAHKRSSSSSSESGLEECASILTASSQGAPAIAKPAVASAAVSGGEAADGEAAWELVNEQQPACAEAQWAACAAAGGATAKLQGGEVLQQQQQGGRAAAAEVAMHAVTDLQQQLHIDGSVVRKEGAGAAAEQQQQQAHITAAAAGDAHRAAAASLSRQQQQQQEHEGPAQAAVPTGGVAEGSNSPKVSNPDVARSAASAGAVNHQLDDHHHQQQQQQQGEDPAAAGSGANASSKLDSTALTPAMEYGSIIAALINAGADPDAAVPNTNAETPLTLAARNGAAIAIAALASLPAGGRKGPDLDKPRGNDLCRPIDLATYYGHTCFAQTLLEEGAHALPDSRCIAPAGTTILTNSLITGVKKVGGPAADPATAVRAGGATGGFVEDHPEDRAPLQLLVNTVNNCFLSSAKEHLKEDLELVQRIIDEGFPLDVVHGTTGATAVGLAVRANKVEVLKKLIAAGADVDMPWTKGVASSLGGRYDSAGLTPVFDAARLGRADIVDVLIAAGADLNSYTDSHPRMYNYNIVQIAANAGHLDIVLKLVEAGAHWRLGKGQGQMHSVPNILAVKTNSLQASHIEWRLKLIEKRGKLHKALPHSPAASPVAAATGQAAAAAVESCSSLAPVLLIQPRELHSSPGVAAAAARCSQISDVDALMAELGLNETEEPKQQISKKAQKALARKSQQHQQQQQRGVEQLGGKSPCGNTAAAEASSSKSQQHHGDDDQPHSPAASSSSSICVGDHDGADGVVGELEVWFSSTKGHHRHHHQQQQQQSRSTATGAPHTLNIEYKPQQQQHVHKSRQASGESIKLQGPGIVRVVPRPSSLLAAAAVANGRSGAQQQQHGLLDGSAATCSRSVTGNSSARSWEALPRECVDPWAPTAAAAAAETGVVAAPTVVTPPLTPKLAVSRRSSGSLTPTAAAAASASSAAAAARWAVSAGADQQLQLPGAQQQYPCTSWASNSSPPAAAAAAAGRSSGVDLQDSAPTAAQPYLDHSSASPAAAAAVAGQSWVPSGLPDAMREMLMMPALPPAAAAVESTGLAPDARLADTEGQREVLQGLIDDLAPAAAGFADAAPAAAPAAAGFAAAAPAAAPAAAGFAAAAPAAAGFAAAAPAADSHSAAGASFDATITTTSASSSSGNTSSWAAAPAVPKSQVLPSALGAELQLPPMQCSSHLSSPTSSSSSGSSILAAPLFQHQAVLSAEPQPPIAAAVAPPIQLTNAPTLEHAEAAPTAAPPAATATPAAPALAAAAAARLPPHLQSRHASTACPPPPLPPPAAAADTPKPATMQLSQLLPLHLLHARNAATTAATASTPPGASTPVGPVRQGLTSLSAILQPAAQPLVLAPSLAAHHTLCHAAAAVAVAAPEAGTQQRQQQQGGTDLQQQQRQQQHQVQQSGTGLQQQQGGTDLQQQPQQQQQQQQQSGTGLQQWKGNLPPSLMFALGRQSSSGGSAHATVAAATARGRLSSSNGSSDSNTSRMGHAGPSSSEPKPQPTNACSISLGSHDSSCHPGASSSHPPSPVAAQATAVSASRINTLPSWLRLGARAAPIATSTMLRTQHHPTTLQPVLSTQSQPVPLQPAQQQVLQPVPPLATASSGSGTVLAAALESKGPASSSDAVLAAELVFQAPASSSETVLAAALEFERPATRSEGVLTAELELQRLAVDPSASTKDCSSSGTADPPAEQLDADQDLPAGNLRGDAGPGLRDSSDSFPETVSNKEADASSSSPSAAAAAQPLLEVDFSQMPNICLSRKDEPHQSSDAKPAPMGKREFELLAARLEAEARELEAEALEEYEQSKAAACRAPIVTDTVVQRDPADLSRTSSSTISDSLLDRCDNADGAQYAADAAIQGLVHGRRMGGDLPPPPPRREARGRYTPAGFGGGPPPGAQRGSGVGSGSGSAYRPAGVGGARPQHQLPQQRQPPPQQHRGRGGASSSGPQGRQQPYPQKMHGARPGVKLVPRPYQPLQQASTTATPSSSSGFVFSGLQHPVGGKKWQQRTTPRDDVTQLQTVELLSHAAKALMPVKRKYGDQHDGGGDGV